MCTSLWQSRAMTVWRYVCTWSRLRMPPSDYREGGGGGSAQEQNYAIVRRRLHPSIERGLLASYHLISIHKFISNAVTTVAYFKLYTYVVKWLIWANKIDCLGKAIERPPLVGEVSSVFLITLFTWLLFVVSFFLLPYFLSVFLFWSSQLLLTNRTETSPKWDNTCMRLTVRCVMVTRVQASQAFASAARRQDTEYRLCGSGTWFVTSPSIHPCLLLSVTETLSK
jgi:hypothetical protein